MEMQMQNGTQESVTAARAAAAGVAPGAESFKISEAPATERKAPLTQVERDLAVRLASASVADAIGLMMRSDRHRHYALADLEWLLLPPLMLNQAMFAYARPQVPSDQAEAAAKAGLVGELPPVAMAMITWSLVSQEVAAKLDTQKKAGVPYRLAPNEWKSGNELRVIDALGDQQAVQKLFAKIAEQARGQKSK